MKKMKDKQRREIHEDKTSYLPPSPLLHKLPLLIESHYQSSSSPVGRPPPLIDASDASVLADMDSFFASQEGESSALVTNPCFIKLNEQQMDFSLFDLLGENSQGNIDDTDEADSMSLMSSDYLFPILVDRQGHDTNGQA